MQTVPRETPDDLAALPLFSGPGYRVDSGFAFRGTAADIVRFEENELGNDLGVPPDALRALEEFSSRQLIWVTRTRAQARRYLADGQTDQAIVEIQFPETARVVADLGYEGVLVLGVSHP